MAPRAAKIEVPDKMNKLVAQYIALRDRIAEIKELQKAQLEQYTSMLEKLGGQMMAFLKDTGQEAARTDEGTVYLNTKHYASLKDPDAYDLMDRRANSVACREFEQEHGSLPPGVHVNSIETVGVRSK